MFEHVIAWLKENRERIVLFLCVILVGVLAFEAGMLQGQIRQAKPLVLSIPSVPENVALSEKAEEKMLPNRTSDMEPVVSQVKTATSCFLVGSKNSDKYHLSTCAVAKRIKPENKVCFASREEAEKKGYGAGCLK